MRSWARRRRLAKVERLAMGDRSRRGTAHAEHPAVDHVIALEVDGTTMVVRCARSGSLPRHARRRCLAWRPSMSVSDVGRPPDRWWRTRRGRGIAGGDEALVRDRPADAG
jgi:hypothetical protein